MRPVSSNIREIFLLQLAIVCLVVLFCMILAQMLDLTTTTPWASFIAVTVALVAVAVVTWRTYRATQRLLAPMDWLLGEVARWDPQRPDMQPLAEAHIPAEVQGSARQMAIALHGLGARLDAFIARERDFTRDASHELRTPLTVIRVAADMLSHDHGMSDRSRRCLGRILNANAGMESLIDALLLLARDGDVAMQIDEYPVRDIVEMEVAKVMPLLEDKGVELDLQMDAPTQHHAQPRVLGVMLGNLLSNAVNYTDSGRIRLHLQEDRIVITDTGIGMDATALARAFEPFYRVNPEHAGSGLGLSIAHRIGERCGWDLTLESTPGKGTRATIMLGPCTRHC